MMELCQERRGTFDHLEYLNEERVQVSCTTSRSPRIVLDFYDQLKSRDTQGYASFDYDMIGFREGRSRASSTFSSAATPSTR